VSGITRHQRLSSSKRTWIVSFPAFVWPSPVVYSVSNSTTLGNQQKYRTATATTIELVATRDDDDEIMWKFTNLNSTRRPSRIAENPMIWLYLSDGLRLPFRSEIPNTQTQPYVIQISAHDTRILISRTFKLDTWRRACCRR